MPIPSLWQMRGRAPLMTRARLGRVILTVHPKFLEYPHFHAVYVTLSAGRTGQLCLFITQARQHPPCLLALFQNAERLVRTMGVEPTHR